MNSAIFLTVRNKATRLPGKHFLEINGRTTIEHLIDRLKMAQKPDRIVLCTSINPDDNRLVEVAKRNSIDYFQGSEDDKLDRYLDAAEKFNIELMVTVDGDDLFTDSVYIDKIVEAYCQTKYDYITCKGLPFGAASHGMKIDALRAVCDKKSETDTEVWGNYFLKNPDFNVKTIDADATVNYPDFRMSLDYIEDFNYFERIFEELGDKNTFSLEDIVNIMKENPDIREINQHMHQVYEQNIQKKEEKVLRDLE